MVFVCLSCSLGMTISVLCGIDGQAKHDVDHISYRIRREVCRAVRRTEAVSSDWNKRLGGSGVWAVQFPSSFISLLNILLEYTHLQNNKYRNLCPCRER